MRGFRLLAVMTLGIAVMISGCARFHHGQPQEPRTLYSNLDATSMVYSDPSVASAVEDHPFRWLGFALHPIGVVLDYAVNRVFYRTAAQMPALTGYSGEDAQLDLQRLPITEGRPAVASSPFGEEATP